MTLNIECRVATDMKFANSQRDLDTTPWEGRFRDTISWTIEGIAGNNTVYAMFSDGTNETATEDSIEFIGE